MSQRAKLNQDPITARLSVIFADGAICARAEQAACDGGPVRLALFADTAPAGAPTCYLTLAPRSAPHTTPDDAPILPADSHDLAINISARRALRDAISANECAARLQAARLVALPHRAPLLTPPPRVLYHGGPLQAFLAMESLLEDCGVALTAAVTPVSSLEHLQRGGADAMVLDATKGQARALSILSALKRNPKTTSAPVLVIAAMRDKEFEIAAARRGARGIWTLQEACTPAFVDWLVHFLNAKRRADAVSCDLEALADAALVQGVRADSYRQAHLHQSLMHHNRAYLIAMPCKTQTGAPVRVNDVVSLLRRIVRSSDSVFWRPNGLLTLLIPEAGRAQADIVAERAAAMLPNAGLLGGPSLILHSTAEERPHAFAHRVDRALAAHGQIM